eukprot:CAMPEP_0206475380 /NCGR_PEP_ID=MMETSP0324_2-20121206/34039_1 /ASSEMBLY_ACC=CAM_ASM_000836 /TAXON_ID=2866 /ORGANISM="Crypthecodinium cohnii, Strain Seligo" /LENGTH=43 /DNA_ID= /DNA_START= /DNA_END= /DNA_ORIENTATION=
MTNTTIKMLPLAAPDLTVRAQEVDITGVVVVLVGPGSGMKWKM